MSDRQLRNQVRIDYATLHDSGERVPLLNPSLPTSNTSVSATPAVSAPVEMSSIPKVTGELSGLLFQIGEILEDLGNVNSLSIDVLNRNLDELKTLRVCVVKVSSELRLLKAGEEVLEGATPTAGIDAQVEDLLQSSKAMITTLRNAIDVKMQSVERQNAAAQQQKDHQVAAQARERKFAFDKIITEIIGLSGACEQFYKLTDEGRLTSEMVLERKEMKGNFAADLARLRVLVDRVLNYTDVQFVGKETLLNNHLANINKLEGMKLEFELKLHADLENFDLTDQKLKLATQTKVDIGKFSGSLEKGMDFYMFKSKFMRAYSKHPKSLLVEWLVNNHLEGKARDCVGSLEDIDEIWERLKTNFGDTQELLMHQFKKINQLGPIQRQKTFELKKHYLQKLVNIMQDIHDIAVEHDLTNQLYYGPHIQKVVNVLENRIQTKFCEIIASEDVGKRDQWMRLHTLLSTELQVTQIRVSQMFESEDIPNKKNNEDQQKKDPPGAGSGSGPNRGSLKVLNASELCQLCDEKHSRHNEAFTLCKRFLLATIKQRHDLVMRKKRCLQCLEPKVRWDKSHDCSELWACPNSSHGSFSKKLHFLLCAQHAEDDANKEKYQEFKITVLTAEWQKKLHSSVFITIHSFTVPAINASSGSANQTGVKIEEIDTESETAETGGPVTVVDSVESDSTSAEETGGPVATTNSVEIDSTPVEENDRSLKEIVCEHAEGGNALNADDGENASAACYMLQPYPLEGHVYSMMFDTGCGRFVSRDGAIDMLPKKYKKNTRPGPIFISGVGCQVAESKYGEYKVSLPTFDNKLVDFTGISLNVITGAISPYPLKEVSKDIVADYVRERWTTF